MFSFQSSQYQFTQHLRQPDQNPAPSDIEDRRMGIYRDLIFNNIEGFISGAFPVLRRILPDAHWYPMVRDFVATHQSSSPYFLEISQEFLHYLMNERRAQAGDPEFMLELAHYEWVELALDVASEVIPARSDVSIDVLIGRPQISPVVWCLSYQYPVHLLSAEYQPTEPSPAPWFLIVYRNRADEVKFLEANAVTIRLLQLLEQDNTLTGLAAIKIVSDELQHTDFLVMEREGRVLLEKLTALDIIANVI